MSDDTFLLLLIAGAVLLVVVWLLYLAAGLVLVFTAFVLSLSPIIAILMFILFPPTLIVFLVGLAFMFFGVADAMAGSDGDPDKPKPVSRADKEELARRRALGYDE